MADKVEDQEDPKERQFVDQDVAEFAADGRPMFQGDVVAFFQGEKGRLVLAIYGTGVIMAVPLTIQGAQSVKAALDAFLANPLAFPQMGPKDIIQ